MDIREITGKGKLLPPPEGHCRICAVDHEPHLPHDASNLFFQMRFRLRYGRDGTWGDAFAHCEGIERHQAIELVESCGGVWTEPPYGVDPISEPIDG